MKEKRYFCDWCEQEISKISKLTILVLLFFMALTLVIISTIHYKIKINQQEAKIEESYSEAAYEYLDNIAEEVIQKGKGIDEMAIPEDVVEYEITKVDDKVIFKYYLDNNKGKNTQLQLV